MINHRAFTIVELLIVIAIIMLLIALVFGALAGARAGAQRARTAGALRQMVAGYNTYATENSGFLLPGYMKKSTVQSLQITARLESGAKLDNSTDNPGAATVCNRSSYVYRLLPYVDMQWRTMTLDYQSPKLDGMVENEIRNGILGRTSSGYSAASHIGLAERTSFGLNSLMLGGDDFHGEIASGQNPWSSSNPLAAVRHSKVRSPARQIVFCPTKSWDADGSPHPLIPEIKMGYVEIRPPFTTFDANSQTWSNQQWQLSPNDPNQATPHSDGDYSAAAGGGLPIARWGDVVPVGTLDGSVNSFSIAELISDMSRWAPFETRSPGP